MSGSAVSFSAGGSRDERLEVGDGQEGKETRGCTRPDHKSREEQGLIKGESGIPSGVSVKGDLRKGLMREDQAQTTPGRGVDPGVIVLVSRNVKHLTGKTSTPVIPGLSPLDRTSSGTEP